MRSIFPDDADFLIGLVGPLGNRGAVGAVRGEARVLDEDALWRRCELAWGSWLEDHGYAVTPLGEAAGNTSRSQAPLTMVAGEYLRSPDFSAIKDGTTEFWEVKSRSRAAIDPLTGQSQHWIDKAAFRDYLKINLKTGTRVWVVLYEAPTATSPGRWLQTDVVHLREIGTVEMRRGASGAMVEAWVWPVSEMREIPGPVVDVSTGEEPILPAEGEGDPLAPDDLFLVERTLRRRRRPSAVPAEEPSEVDETPLDLDAGPSPLPHEWLEQEPASALDVLRRSLGVPHFPRYSVLRIGLDGTDVDDLLGLIEYGIRVFVVSSSQPETALPQQLMDAYQDARLLEWAVVPDADSTKAWIVDGVGVDDLPSDVRAVLEKGDEVGGINLAQYEVVHAPADSDVVVSAGAGTGKTETMSERIVYLLATGSGRSSGEGEGPQDLRADDIALITFTRESASEMRHRIARTLLLRRRLCRSCALPVVAWMLQLARADIATIHSFAKRVIAAGGGAVGLGPETRVARRTLEVHDAVQRALSERLVELINQHHEAVPAAHEWQKHVLAIWEALENNGVDLLDVAGQGLGKVDWGAAPDGALGQQVVDLTRWVVETAAADMAATYLRDQTLTTNGLVPAATAVLRSSASPQVRAYRHLFVDEFQDTDAAQMELILDVRERIGARLFVVGDVKQGIYRFRGAEGNAFKELDDRVAGRKLPSPRTFNLTRNFRSGQRLLDSMHPWFAQWGADGLLPYDASIDRLRPDTSKPDASVAACVERADAKHFAEEAAALVERWDKLHPGDSIGILCRENWQAIEVQKAVRQRGLSCELRVGGSFWSSPAVRELRVLLEAVADPHDDAALLELCETRWAAGLLGGEAPARVDEEGWGGSLAAPSAWQARFAHVAEAGSFLREDLRPLRERVVLLGAMLSTTPLLEWVVECTRVFAPEACSLPAEDDDTERRRYGRCLDHLLTLLDNQFQDGPLSLERLLSWLRLQVATNRNEDEPDPETDGHVVALTVHKAKGLEYERVVVPSTDRKFGPPKRLATRTAVLRPQGKHPRLLWRWQVKHSGADFSNVPLARQQVDWGTDDADTAREEARLLYVAMTRARKELVLMVDQHASARPGDPTCWADLLLVGGRDG